jgi:hypothetical protein
MSNPTTPAHEEFEDLGSHRQMWNAFTKWIVGGTISVIVVVLFIGFVTGTL